MTLLSCVNLHKTYRMGRVLVPVLRGASLGVNKGEFVGILGSSGSGKSTLLHLLGGLDRPDAARSCPKCGYSPVGLSATKCPECGTPNEASEGSCIVFEGRDVTRYGPGDLNLYRRRDVGFVFQFYHLLPELSVLQNVLIASMVRHGIGFFGQRGDARSLALELLSKVGLSHRLHHRPAELSGGERQRVAIARALINRPRLLLADEPTGNLDQTTGATILDMLAELRRTHAQTMLIVTHDAQTAARADRIIHLRDGKVAG